MNTNDVRSRLTLGPPDLWAGGIGVKVREVFWVGVSHLGAATPKIESSNLLVELVWHGHGGQLVTER